ncbi:GNAT family N-acetyltransferase [Lysinibacillus sp. NPDC096418]|uniref:GNAT family N-acetyltransferase n=1 Tax=Lysinibacillus sp. NPDC096418 TaxID=3364138 RepID=UPI0038033688
MLEYRLVKSLNELEPYRETWSEILEVEKNDNPFVEYEWVATWWRMLGSEENIEIYVVEYNGKAVAFFPFIHIIRFGGIHQFGFLGQGFATYMEVISKGMWKEQAIEYMLSELARTFPRVLFVFHGLLESKETSRILEKYAIQRELSHSIFRIVTPYIDFESIELSDFMKKHHKKFKSINRREKRLKSLGKLTFQEVIDNKLDKMFHLFERRWRRKLDTSGFAEVQTRNFIESLATQRNGAIHVEVGSLQFEGRWIGFTIDICCRGRNLCHAMGHEPDFNLFGPGRLIEKENMLKAHNSNYRIYDFGSGYEPYKFEWYTHLDFTRKFVMSSSGKRERIVKAMLVMCYSLKEKLKTNYQLVSFKRNRIGEIMHLFKEAHLKEWVATFVNGFKRIFYMNLFDIYYLDKSVCEKEFYFYEVPIQEVLEHEKRSELISYYFKGYKLYSEDKQSISFLQHDRWIREESTGFMQELPSNSTYVKTFDSHNLSNVVGAVQKKKQTIFTSVKWYEWRKRRELAKLGFQKIERIWVNRFFKWKKMARQNNKWENFIQKKGQSLNQVWHMIFLPLLI